MKNWKLNVALFIAAYLVFVIANVPASVIVNNVTLPQGVKLGPVSGSMWNGKIDIVQHRNDVITDVQWQLSALPLLMGSLSSSVKFGPARKASAISGKGDIVTNFAMDHFSVSDFVLRYPAADFVKKMKVNLPTTISGRMIVNLDDFDQGKPYCENLDGTVVWRKATVLGLSSTPIQLGTIDAELACQKGEVELKVTKKNPMGLQITSLIGAKNKFTVKGFVKPNGDMPDEVHQGVKILGNADSQGRYPVNF